jgi:asparaginyl-tRNA synthetase
VELKATKVVHVGRTDPAGYPLAKKKQTFEFLREKGHLRPRTNTIGAVARIRNALAYATHSFFQERGFLYVHTPIITAADCEGAGEMFQVTTLLGAADEAATGPAPPSADEVTALRAGVDAAAAATKQAKAAAAADKGDAAAAAASKAAVAALLAAKAELAQAEER